MAAPPPPALPPTPPLAHQHIDPGIGMGAALDATPDAVVILRPILDADAQLLDLEYLYANAAVRNRWWGGRPLGEVIGQRVFATMPDYALPLRNAYEEVLRTGRPWHELRTFATPIGPRALDLSMTAFEGGIVHISRDATDLLLAASAAHASEERLKRIVDGVDAVLVAMESADAPIVTSPQVTAILGYAPEELTTFEAWDSKVHPDDLEASERAWNDPANAWDIEYRIRHAGGAWVWIADRGVRRIGPDGDLQGMYSTLVDVTARREAEALAARLMRLQRAASDIDRVAARAGDRQSLFAQACEIAVAAGGLRLAWVGMVDNAKPGREVAVQASAGPGKGFLDGYHAVLDTALPHADRIAARAIREDRTILIRIDEPMPEDIREAAERFGFGSSVFVPLRRDGEPVGVFVVYRADPDAFDESELALLERIAEDVSHRLYMLDHADAARLAAARDRLLVQESADGIVRLALPDARILDANPAAATMLGTTPEALRGTRITDRFIEGEPPTLRGIDVAAAGETIAFERSLRAADGRVVMASGRARQLPDGTLLVSLRDVTAERALEAQLRQAQRLEAVGHLAGGIAHDFNNLLLAIGGYAGLVRESLDAEAAQQEDLAQIEAAASRASALTRQLLLFARHQRLEPTIFEAAPAVERLVPMLRRLLGEHIEVVVRSPSAPAHVRVDAGQFEQVVVNLAVNARDAMPDGGRLEIAVSAENGPGRPGDSARVVRITVSDTGIGMDGPTMAEIFTPFFTTKPVGQGTGLGLATVHGIVAASGGRIAVDSTPGRGTTFTIDLPLAAPADATAAVVAAAMGPSTARRILLVEDDDAVRNVIARVLGRLGHEVTSTSSGAEAIEVARRGDIDLLLTDVRMPGLQGPDVARRVQALLPGTPVILMSGFDAECTVDIETLAPAVHLQKPFAPDALAGALAKLLPGA